MNSPQTLLNYLDKELKNLNQLIDQDEVIRDIVDSRVTLSIRKGQPISDKELSKLANKLSDTHIYLLESGAINETHFQICLTIMSIVIAIESCSEKNAAVNWIPGLRH